MPTEEVFTAPDARRVDGAVRASYPLQLQGTIVRGLELRFAGSSRVGRTGIVFYDTLFDENAASHIALGTAILSTVAGALELSPEARHDLGINHSSIHTDFMIGSPDLLVAGLTAAGDEVAILDGGSWVLS